MMRPLTFRTFEKNYGPVLGGSPKSGAPDYRLEHKTEMKHIFERVTFAENSTFRIGLKAEVTLASLLLPEQVSDDNRFM